MSMKQILSVFSSFRYLRERYRNLHFSAFLYLRRPNNSALDDYFHFSHIFGRHASRCVGYKLKTRVMLAVEDIHWRHRSGRGRIIDFYLSRRAGRLDNVGMAEWVDAEVVVFAAWQSCMASWKIRKGSGVGVPNIQDRLYISETELVAHGQAMGVPWPPYQDSPATFQSHQGGN